MAETGKTAASAVSSASESVSVSESESESDTFSPEERAAMKERAKELKAGSRRRPRADPLAEVLEKIAAMPDADRAIAERLHTLVTEHAPELSPKTWYGMPAYARDGKVVVFFQSGATFKTRYSTIGFSDNAALDDGALWPTAYAVTRLGDAEAAQIVRLLRTALG